MQNHHRLQIISKTPWIWLDQTKCSPEQGLSCYFNIPSKLCQQTSDIFPLEKNTPQQGFVTSYCPDFIYDSESRTQFRTATTAYLFGSGLSDFVLDEVQRQLHVIFPHGLVPAQMITVHVRVNDKSSEMRLVSMNEYVSAVQRIVDSRKTIKGQDNTINIYVSTEDPKIEQLFKAAAPSSWNIYVDIFPSLYPGQRGLGNWDAWASVALKGGTCTQSLASLVIAMESNDFVLTTKSNWSRLMDQLRRGLVDKICGDCTTMIDLRPGFW